MFHLLILAIIKPLYIDIQVFVYFNNSKTIIFGKTSFYHSFHRKIVDSMPETIVTRVMMSLDNGYDLAALLKYRNDLLRIADTKFLTNTRKVSNSSWIKITTGKSSFFSSCCNHSLWLAGINALVQSKLPES